MEQQTIVIKNVWHPGCGTNSYYFWELKETKILFLYKRIRLLWHSIIPTETKELPLLGNIKIFLSFLLPTAFKLPAKEEIINFYLK